MTRVEDVKEVFKVMVDDFDPDAVGDMDAVYQFDIAGDGGGQWWTKITGGQIEVNEGETGDPTTTFHMEAKDFLGIVNGLHTIVFALRYQQTAIPQVAQKLPAPDFAATAPALGDD